MSRIPSGVICASSGWLILSVMKVGRAKEQFTWNSAFFSEFNIFKGLLKFSSIRIQLFILVTSITLHVICLILKCSIFEICLKADSLVCFVNKISLTDAFLLGICKVLFQQQFSLFSYAEVCWYTEIALFKIELVAVSRWINPVKNKPLQYQF
jgi:hypothetical protein